MQHFPCDSEASRGNGGAGGGAVPGRVGERTETVREDDPAAQRLPAPPLRLARVAGRAHVRPRRSTRFPGPLRRTGDPGRGAAGARSVLVHPVDRRRRSGSRPLSAVGLSELPADAAHLPVAGGAGAPDQPAAVLAGRADPAGRAGHGRPAGGRPPAAVIPRRLDGPRRARLLPRASTTSGSMRASGWRSTSRRIWSATYAT